MSQKSITLFASSPNQGDVARFKADAAALIKARLEVEINLDPRKPIDVGSLVASCRGLALSFQRRAQHVVPGGTLSLFAVYGRSGEKPAVYLGNEVRLPDGCVVAQRLRSPESAEEFRLAATGAARHAKSANLFLANWRDETVVDKETAKKMVVLQFPGDMTAGVAYRLSWYTREHMIGAGRVDLRPAMPALCQALDDAEAAKAAAEAEAAKTKEAVEALVETADAMTVTELKAQAKALGIVGVSKLRKDELLAKLEAAAKPEVFMVTEEQLTAINVAINLATGVGGEGRLRTALSKAGVRVDLSGEVDRVAALVAAAKRCVVAESVTA